MAAPNSPDAALESLVGRIADEFTRRHQRGEDPQLDEYTARYPELAELLVEILPAIQALSPARGETPRPNDTPGGAFVVPPSGSLPAKAGTTNQLADYEILAEIGRGGMGVVYQARHRTLGRIVALKMLRSRDAADLARFRIEAQAVARLQHPNVVQIFEIQEADGQPFLALEYVAGGSLAERIQGEPQPPREAAALVETLARAVAAAHERGLVHRDLKPSNVLLVSGGVVSGESSVPDSPPLTTHHSPLTSCIPKITDFGLAKRLDQDLGQTQSGAIVGTPSYMAPEQAMDGASVGPAADIFALGAILFELIAGRPPFKGPSVLETLELVRHAEPTPPSQLQPGCPRDLETICLKCLHKDPTRRYASASLLAEDLGRFLNNEPIQARPVGNLERLGKWLRRRPALAASLGLGALAALAVVTLTVRLLYSWELEDANQKLGEAVGAKETALSATQEARRLAEQNHQAAEEARTKLDAALERELALHYVHSIGLAQRELQANRVNEARRILDACPPALRHWEWHYLQRQCHLERTIIRGHIGVVGALAVSPNGKLIAAASSAQAPHKEWDLKIWDAATGKLTCDLLGHQGVIGDVAFSPDGALLASMSRDQTIRLWDPSSGRELRKIGLSVLTSFLRLAFSPDGKRLAACAGSQIRLYEIASGAELFELAGHTKLVTALAFSANGKQLVSGGEDRLIKLWDLTTKQEIFSSGGHGGSILRVAFSPKQDQIVSCGNSADGTVRGEIRLWSARDGKPMPPTLTFPASVGSAAFTPDALQIACTNPDGSILFLDAKSGTTRFTLRGHEAPVIRLVFTPDGKELVSSSADGTIRIWPAQNPEFAEIVQDPSSAVAFSADGSHLAAVTHSKVPKGGTTWVRNISVSPPQVVLELPTLKSTSAIALSSVSRWLAVARANAVRLHDLDKVRERQQIIERGVVDLSFSPDGKLLATATSNPAIDLHPERGTMRAPADEQAEAAQSTPVIKIWRIPNGPRERMFQRTLPGQISVAFSPDGQRLAGAHDCGVKLWDVATGKELSAFTGPTDPVLKVQFLSAGRQIVGFTHRQATFWDIETGQIIATVDGLNGPAFATPDGRRVVGLHSGILKWWDVRTGRELLFLASPEARFSSLALSADSHRLAAGAEQVMIWED